MADYQFKYSPLTGRLTGNQMLEQTEQAINALASQVESAAGQVEIISTLANEANENAATALETAEEALATTGRTYITVSTQTDANNYYDSQLIYIADSTSTNIPVADTGMLEVKTNDNKTSCEQVFIADSSGDAYYRNGDITAETVGDVTTYTVTWGGWSSQPASQEYVQQELTNYAPLASLDKYLPLSGGTMTGDISHDAQGNSFFIKEQQTDKAVCILGGGLWSNGASLYLRGKDYNSAGGEFSLEAHDGITNKKLVGKPDGTLTWAGFNLGVTAVSPNYIRYDNGLQICWGHTANKTVNGNSKTSQVVTFPVAFKNSDYSVSVTSRYVSGSWTNNTTLINNNTTTSVELLLQNVTGSTYGFYFVWMAVGYWK